MQKQFKGGFRKTAQRINSKTNKIGATLLGLVALVVIACITDSLFAASGISMAMSLPLWMKKGSGDNAEFSPLDENQLKDLSEEDRGRYYRAQLKSMQDTIGKTQSSLEDARSNGATKEEMDAIKSSLESQISSKFETMYKAQDAQGRALKGILDRMKTGESRNESVLSLVKNFVETTNPAERVKSKVAGFERLAIKAPALMTIGSSVLPNVAGGFSANVNNFIDEEIGGAPKPERFILDLVSVENQTGAENIWYTDRQNEEGDAAFIGEGDLKPLIDAEYQTSKAEVKEVAERWKMSNRMIMHTNRVVADFREHADELIDLKIDTGILTGDGIGNNLSGITTEASAFVAPAGLANFYTDTNIYDVIHAAATQVMLANFVPSQIILNTVWMAKMKGIKNSQGDYIVPPFVTPDGQTVSGMKIKFTSNPAFTADDIVIGDLSKFKVVFAEDVMFDQGWENDDFSKNLTSNKLEAFLGTYIKANHVPAIVYDSIATITTAITFVPAP